MSRKKAFKLDVRRTSGAHQGTSHLVFIQMGISGSLANTGLYRVSQIPAVVRELRAAADKLESFLALYVPAHTRGGLQ